MADENVTKNETTTETTAQETQGAAKAPKPAAPKPHAPSPAAFAKKAAPAARVAASAVSHTEAQVKQAESFGRVDDNGNRVPIDVAEGDVVIYSKYGGTEVKQGGQEYLVLSARDVLAIVVK